MRRNPRIIIVVVSAFAAATAFATPLAVRAHEAYVLSADDFAKGMTAAGPNPFAALEDPANFARCAIISVCVIAVLLLNLFARQTKLGKRVHAWFDRFEPYGALVMRLSIAASLFLGALTWNFLGPELTLRALPVPEVLRFALMLASGLIAVGFLTEFGAAAALAVFSIAFFRYGLYLATYFNYLGELAALVLFGARHLSMDEHFIGGLRRFPWFRKYEQAIIRISYGIGLIYAGYTIKLLHPMVTLMVVDQYHLTRFSHMFPSDPLLIVLGGAFGEIAIGLFVLFGFELRLAILVSLYYITLSLLFFRELVWPHLLLYGIGVYLLVAKETFTLDAFIDGHWPWGKKLARRVAAIPVPFAGLGQVPPPADVTRALAPRRSGAASVKSRPRKEPRV